MKKFKKVNLTMEKFKVAKATILIGLATMILSVTVTGCAEADTID